MWWANLDAPKKEYKLQQIWTKLPVLTTAVRTTTIMITTALIMKNCKCNKPSKYNVTVITTAVTLVAVTANCWDSNSCDHCCNCISSDNKLTVTALQLLCSFCCDCTMVLLWLLYDQNQVCLHKVVTETTCCGRQQSYRYSPYLATQPGGIKLTLNNTILFCVCLL